MTHARSGRARERQQHVTSIVPDRVRLWAQVVVQSIKDMFEDDGPQWAAALAYYAILSAFPVVIIVGIFASFFIDPEDAVRRLTTMLGEFVPQEGTVRDTVNNAINARGRVGLIAGIGLLWTGTRLFDALIRAMNTAFGVQSGYTFWKRLLVEVVMLVTIGLIFILAVLSQFLMEWIWQAIQVLPSQEELAIQIIQIVVQGSMLLLAFFLIYRFVPRDGPDWRAALGGAVIATGLFLVVSPLFQYWVSQSGNYNLIYGSFAAVVIILVWVFIGSVITIFGGELASHIQEMVIKGRSAEDVQRDHTQRSGS